MELFFIYCFLAPGAADELFAQVLSGIADVSVVARKAFLQMLGRLLRVKYERFDRNVMDTVLRVAQDPAKTMRTSNIEVVCELLMAAENAPDDLITVWNRVVFHLYMDAEQTVKEKISAEFQVGLSSLIDSFYWFIYPLHKNWID